MVPPMTTTSRHTAPERALCFELPATEGAAPDWVELLPAGPEIVGRDGRRWRMTDAARVIAATAAVGRPLVFDWEHGSETLAPKGRRAPAAGWIEAFEVREGAVWGQVSWTDQGRADVTSRAYRFLSPTFDFDPQSGEIVRLVSAGLVHAPNLPVRALNREEPMDLTKLCQALGLAATATMDEVLAAVGKQRQELMTATNRAENPPLERFVPRADYDALVARATNAEQKLAKVEADALKAEVDQAIAGALKEGKITPATEAYHRAMCRDRAALDEFRKFVAAAPKVLDPTPAITGDKPAGGGQGDAALTAEERAMCREMGVSEDAFLKTKRARAGGA